MPAPRSFYYCSYPYFIHFQFSFLSFYGIFLFLFTARHSYPILLSCRFFPVYVAMLQYNRICDVTTRYRSVAVNSHPSAMLAEIWVFISACIQNSRSNTLDNNINHIYNNNRNRNEDSQHCCRRNKLDSLYCRHCASAAY